MRTLTLSKIAASLVFLALSAQHASAQNAPRPRVAGTVNAAGAKDSTNTISAGSYVNTYRPTGRGTGVTDGGGNSGSGDSGGNGGGNGGSDGGAGGGGGCGP